MCPEMMGFFGNKARAWAAALPMSCLVAVPELQLCPVPASSPQAVGWGARASVQVKRGWAWVSPLMTEQSSLCKGWALTEESELGAFFLLKPEDVLFWDLQYEKQNEGLE